jgi:hypothetical protein
VQGAPSRVTEESDSEQPSRAIEAAWLKTIEGRIRQVGDWSGRQALTALTIVGLVFYGGALVAYSRFYGAFGITPDEAGLDYTSTLARTIPAFMFWVANLVGLVVVVFVVGYLAVVVLDLALGAIVWLNNLRRRPAATDKEDGDSASRETAEPAKAQGDTAPELHGGKLVLVVLIALSLPIFFLGGALEHSDKLAARVQAGEQIRNRSQSEIRSAEVLSVSDYVTTFSDLVDYYRDAYENPFDIRIDRVKVSPAEQSGTLPLGLDQEQTYAYLGRSSDTIILYGNDQTLRVPANLIVVSDPIAKGE